MSQTLGRLLCALGRFSEAHRFISRVWAVPLEVRAVQRVVRRTDLAIDCGFIPCGMLQVMDAFWCVLLCHHWRVAIFSDRSSRTFGEWKDPPIAAVHATTSMLCACTRVLYFDVLTGCSHITNSCCGLFCDVCILNTSSCR